MKFSLGLLGIWFVSLLVTASPFHVFCDITEAVTIGERGWTAFSFKLSDDGPAIHLGRALGRRIDVFTTLTTEDFFQPGLRVLLVKDMGPLNAVLTVTKEACSFSSGLRLGPVHFDWGRDFGVHDRRSGTLAVSPDQRVAVILGWESLAGKGRPIFGIRLFPESGLRGVSILICPEGGSVTFGGIF